MKTLICLSARKCGIAPGNFVPEQSPITEIYGSTLNIAEVKVMISKKFGIVILFLATMALPNLILVSYAQQPEQVGASIGDKVRLQSVRGSTALRGDNMKWYNASIDLVGEITELNGTHVRFRILDGGIQVGDEHYSIAGGRLNAVYKRFGWLGIIGNATSSTGTAFGFHLEGMLHIERPGLVVAGLAGPLVNETTHYVLRLGVRLERIM
jgi:hypothetical protein